jgi:LuxR family maltose regulon positive regulatory protein
VAPAPVADEVTRLAERALDLLDPADLPFRATATYCRAQAALAGGDPRRAEHLFTQAAALSREGGLSHSVLVSGMHLVGVAGLRGARRRALEIGRAALAEAGEHVGPPTVGLLRSVMADLLLDGDDQDAARSMAQEALRLQRGHGAMAPLMLMAWLPIARLRLVEGDSSGAAQALVEAGAMVEHEPFAHLQPLVDAVDAQVGLARGDLPSAVAWARATEPVVPAGQLPFQAAFYRAALEAGFVTPVRVLAAAGRARRDSALLAEAERRLSAAEDLATRCGLGWLRVRGLVLRALLADAVADEQGARTALEQAVDMAEPEGVLRPFLDEGPPMAGLVRELAAAGDRPFATTILAAFGGPAPPPAPLRDGHGMPVEPLTARETEVLRLLVSGDSNALIAQTLFVELSTVKTHLINLYTKLGVHNRVAAIGRARELHLLD